MKEATLDARTHSIPRPGWLGRILRFAVGAFQSSFVVSVAPRALRLTTGPIVDNPAYWLAIAIAFWLLPLVIDIGFTQTWGRRSQAAAIGLALLAALGGLLLYGQVWSPLLATRVFALGVYVHTHLGLSHLLAALLATPGCEMRAVPHLLTLLRGGDPQTQVCPGMWDGLDRWETGSPLPSTGGSQ